LIFLLRLGTTGFQLFFFENAASVKGTAADYQGRIGIPKGKETVGFRSPLAAASIDEGLSEPQVFGSPLV
jgi:hypothetical protein